MAVDSPSPKNNSRRNFLRTGASVTLTTSIYPALGAARVTDRAAQGQAGSRPSDFDFELDEIPKYGRAPEYDYSHEPLQTTLPHTAPFGASRPK